LLLFAVLQVVVASGDDVDETLDVVPAGKEKIEYKP
jgi:hypothetical protein